MRTMPTYRRGRTVYHETGDKHPCGGLIMVAVLSSFFMGVPVWFAASEFAHHSSLAAFDEVLNGGVSSLEPSTPIGQVVGLQSSGPLRSTATDNGFGVAVDGALALKRTTEYCQWQEFASQHCQTCSRTVRGKDGTSSTESYSCNCVTEYSYVKSWQRYRVPSVLFNQPAAHYNPQRDPWPSVPVTPAVEGAIVEDRRSGVAAHLSSDLLQRARVPWRPVDWVRDPAAVPAPSWWQGISAWFGGGKDRTLRLDVNSLASVAAAPPAAQRDNFVYVGDQSGRRGYFFSPYDPSLSEQLLKGFGQYLEGSLLDWQVGDLMPSCTPGDLRVSFDAQAPHKISVLAEVGSTSAGGAAAVEEGAANTVAGKAGAAGDATSGAAAGGTPAAVEESASIAGRLVNLVPHSTASSGQHHKKGASSTTVGLVHRGWRTPQEMLADEKSDAWWSAALPRFLVLPLWALGASRLGAMGLFGVDLAQDGYYSKVAWLPATAGLWAWMFGAIIAVVWHSWWPPHALLLGLSGAVLFVQAQKCMPPPTVKSGPRAVWCMLARWSGLPPDWRVEDGYVGALAAPIGDEGEDNGRGGHSSRRCNDGDGGTEMLLTAEIIDDDDEGNYHHGSGGKGSTGKSKVGSAAVPVVVAEAWAGSRNNNNNGSSSTTTSSFGGGGVHRRSNSPGNNSALPLAVAVVAPDHI